MSEAPETLMSRLVWTVAGGVSAMLYNIGTDYQAGVLTKGRLAYRASSALVMMLIADAAAKYLGLHEELRSIAAITIFLVGRDGLEKVALGLVMKWTGLAPPSVPHPPSDSISPRNASSEPRRDLTARESPIAHYGARIGSEEVRRAYPDDPDADLLGKLPDD